MIQFDLIIQLQLLFLGICPSLCKHGIRLHSLLKIFIYKVKTWRCIGDLGNISINTVDTRKHADRCHTKGCNRCHHLRYISTAVDINGNVTKHADNKNGFNEKTRCVIEYRIISRHIRTNLTGLIIVSYKKFFPVQNLYILQAIGCLNTPLCNSRLNGLVFGSDPVQPWLQHLDNKQCQNTEYQYHKQSHLHILNEQHKENKTRYYNFGCQR